MSQQNIGRTERLKLFLREYYGGHTTWINTVRLIGGPLVITAGIQFYHKPDRAAIAYGGFCILYGIYYLLKPFLLVVVRPVLIQPLTFNVALDEQGIRWRENGDESAIQFASFKKIARQAAYYSLKLPNQTTVYLRADQLTEGEQLTLNQHLTAH